MAGNGDERRWEVIPWPPKESLPLIDEETKELPINVGEDSTNELADLNERTSTAEHTTQAENVSKTMLSKSDPDVSSNHATANSGLSASMPTPHTEETQLSEQLPISDTSTTDELKPATEISEQTDVSTAAPDDTRAPGESQSDVQTLTPPSDLITQWCGKQRPRSSDT